MQEIKFSCPLPPSVNAYLGKRVAYNPITRKPFVQVFETAEAKAFKKHMKKVIERALSKYYWLQTGEFTHVECELIVYLSQKHRDTDNLFKCLLDSFTESNLVYDDSMIIPKVKNVYIDSVNPRVEVHLFESNKRGIFDNQEDVDIFTNDNCLRCTRYSRNCSVRREALENRVRAEIDLESLKCDAIKIRKEKK